MVRFSATLGLALGDCRVGAAELTRGERPATVFRLFRVHASQKVSRSPRVVTNGGVCANQAQESVLTKDNPTSLVEQRDRDGDGAEHGLQLDLSVENAVDFSTAVRRGTVLCGAVHSD